MCPFSFWRTIEHKTQTNKHKQLSHKLYIRIKSILRIYQCKNEIVHQNDSCLNLIKVEKLHSKHMSNIWKSHFKIQKHAHYVLSASAAVGKWVSWITWSYKSQHNWLIDWFDKISILTWMHCKTHYYNDLVKLVKFQIQCKFIILIKTCRNMNKFTIMERRENKKAMRIFFFSFDLLLFEYVIIVSIIYSNHTDSKECPLLLVQTIRLQDLMNRLRR